MRITVDDVIGFAAKCAGHPFATMAKAKKFEVRAEGDGITFINHLGKPRANGRKMLGKYVTIFNQQPGVFATKSYVKEKLYDSSYFLTLVARMVDEGEYEAAKANAVLVATLAGLEREFMRAVEKSTRRSQNPERDSEIIAFYYGFRQEPSASQVDAAGRFGVDDRERVRQIIRDNFERKADVRDFPIATTIANELESVAHISADEFMGGLRRRKVIGDVPSPRGLLDLLKNCLGRCASHELYTPDLDQATREKWGRSDQVYFVREDLLPSLTAARAELRGIPGTRGVAKFESVTDATKELAPEQVAFMRRLIVTMSHAWTWEAGDGLWYLFEDKQNPLVNLLRKIRAVTEQCSLTELAPTLSHAIYPHPPEKVVATWLLQTSCLDVRGEIARFEPSFEKVDLTDPESHVREFFQKPENRNCQLGPLKDWLLARGHPDATCQSTIYLSGIVFVDRSAGRGRFTYRLIGQAVATAPVDDRYFQYRERLKNLGRDGTDREAIVRQRKEQAALAEWLFEGKEEVSCAACGRAFRRSALVAAHKKPRRDCNEAERLDPYIVMPLCVFGCDYLYERGHIYFHAGTVRAGRKDNAASGVQQRVGELEGKKVPDEWTQGLPSYFRRPD